MELPPEVRERFREYGRIGGLRRASRMTATLRWIRHRFGDASFEALGLPGGDVVDAGLEDLNAGRTTPEAIAVSLAAPRLRREGVPIGPVEEDPERRLYAALSESEGDLAHARYNAWLKRLVSFADACRVIRSRRSVAS